MALTDFIPGVAQVKTALRVLPWALGAAGCLTLGVMLHVRTGQRDELRGRVTEYAHVMTETRLRFVSAAEKSRADATERARRIETANLKLKQELDHALAINLADARRLGDAYARSHGVRGQGAAAAGVHPGAGDLPGAPGTPGSPDPARGDALVAVTRDDFDICTENSVRLGSGHEWVERLPQF